MNGWIIDIEKLFYNHNKTVTVHHIMGKIVQYIMRNIIQCHDWCVAAAIERTYVIAELVTLTISRYGLFRH